MPQALNFEQIYLGDTYRSFLVVEQPLNVGNNGGMSVNADQLPSVAIYDEQDNLIIPSGIVVGPAPTGVYYNDFIVVSGMNEGLWKMQWDYLVSGVHFQKNEYVYLNPFNYNQAPAGTQYCTAQQVRDLSMGMGIDGFTDPQLDNFADMASRLVDDYTKRTFGISNEVEQDQGMMDVMGRYFFKFKKKPVVKVNSIQLKYVGYPTAMITIPVNALDLFAKDGYAYYAHSYFMRTQGIVLRDEYKGDFYTIIDYDAGAAVPKAISIATALIVQNFLVSVVLASGTGTKQGIESADSISSYESMSFRVSFNKSSMYSDKTGRLLSVSVRDLLDRYVSLGQSW